eukprot:gene302-543_t
MPNKLPKDTKDWHEDLVDACNARYRYSHFHNKKDQNSWKDALNILRESQDHIYIQKGGQKQGHVIGIPKKIKSISILQVLMNIVNEEEPVLKPEHNGLDDNNDLSVEDTKFFRDRKYRDSAYALLAAMYMNTTSMPTILYEDQIKRSARNFTDEPIDYDHRAHKFGVWKSVDTLVRPHQLVHKDSGQRPYNYSLTQTGFQFCHALFNKKFHPSKGPYVLVKPTRCQVTADGVVLPLNARAPFQYLGDGQVDNVHGLHDDFENHNNNNHMDVFRPQMPMQRTTVIVTPSHHIINNPSLSTTDVDDIREARLRRFDMNSIDEFQDESVVDMDPDIQKALQESVAAASVVAKRANVTTTTITTHQEESQGDEDLMTALALSAVEAEEDIEYGEEEYPDDEGVNYADIDNDNNDNDEEKFEIETAIAISVSESFTHDTDTCVVSSKSSSNSNSNNTRAVQVVDKNKNTSTHQSSQTSNASNASSTTRFGYFPLNLDFDLPSESESIDLTTRDSDASLHTPTPTRRSVSNRTRTRSVAQPGSVPLPLPVDLVIDLINDNELHEVTPTLSTVPVSLDTTPNRKRNRNGGTNGVTNVGNANETGNGGELFRRSSLRPPAIPKSVNVIQIDATEPRTELNRTTTSTSSSSTATSSTTTTTSTTTTYRQICLYVDNFERFNNNFYQQFYQDIRRKVESVSVSVSNGGCTVQRMKLPLGDFAWALDANTDNARLMDVLVERKCISDLVSRSSGWNAPHIRQERRLRTCGLFRSMFLIEGDHRGAGRTPGPRISNEGDLDGPDVIEMGRDFVNYIANIVARNTSGQCVRVLQTENIKHTAMLLTAISIVLDHLVHSREQDHWRQRCSQLPRIADFTTTMSRLKGREGDFKRKLKYAGVSPEFLERVCRRFGDANALQRVYRACTSDVHRALLLTELGHGGTNMDCTTLVVGEDEDDVEDPPVSPGEKDLLTDQSVLVYRTLAGEEASGHPTFRRSCSRHVVVSMSSCMDDTLKRLEGFDDSVVGEVHKSPSGRWTIIEAVGVTSSTCRRSSPIRVMVLDGMDVIEALVQAATSCTSDDIRLVEETIALINHTLLPDFIAQRMTKKSLQESNDEPPALILENLLTPTHGALGKLKLAVSRVRSGPGPGAFDNGSEELPSFVSISEQRALLDIAAAQRVETKGYDLLYLLIAMLTVKHGCQCLLSRNEKESCEMLASLINAVRKDTTFCRIYKKQSQSKQQHALAHDPIFKSLHPKYGLLLV